MGVAFMIVVGGISGLFALQLQRRFEWRGLFVNMLIGICGAVAAGLLVCPGLGLGSLLHEPYDGWAILLVSVAAMIAAGLGVILRERRL